MYLIEEYAFGINETDIAISYLPYGHTFEQCIFILSIVKGFSHGYYGGDPLKLIDDIQELSWSGEVAKGNKEHIAVVLELGARVALCVEWVIHTYIRTYIHTLHMNAGMPYTLAAEQR